jgi:uncharacterized protein YnzC (UPF0291/DUF896 family)
MLLPPKLQNLPNSLPIEGAVRIELVEGIPIFRSSSAVQNRIEELLTKQQDSPLTSQEEHELDLYEEIDDYLSFINRTVRNAFLTQAISWCLVDENNPQNQSRKFSPKEIAATVPETEISP